MSRPYAIHSDSECERLERQAVLARIDTHLRHMLLPDVGRILDAGCGSGSMARLLARHAPKCRVIGADLRVDYIAFAGARARAEALASVTFQAADVRQLPWPDGYFDLVWSKYLLQWLDQPQVAVNELCRVLKPGGILVCCNFDGFAVTHVPPDPALQERANRVFHGLIDPFVGRKMATMMFAAGLEGVSVEIEADRLYTVIGAIDPERRRNWDEQLSAARPFIAKILGGDATNEFIRDFLDFQDKPETCSYTVLFFAKGIRPHRPGD